MKAAAQTGQAFRCDCPEYEAGFYFYKVTYTFHFRDDTWISRLQDEGLNQLGAQFSDQGLAQGETANTIKLADTASSMDGAYVGFSVTILSGTDVGDTRDVTAYAGGTRVATVDSAWSVALDETSVCGIIDPSAPPKVTPIYVGAHTTAVPLPLDGKGKRLVRGKPVVYLPYQVYHAMPFTPLSISLTP